MTSDLAVNTVCQIFCGLYMYTGIRSEGRIVRICIQNKITRNYTYHEFTETSFSYLASNTDAIRPSILASSFSSRSLPESSSTSVSGSSWCAHGVIHSFLYKNVVFPAQAEYFYFSADFRLKIFLYYS